MPRGKKKSHKGGHRHFTSEDDLALEAEKARKEQEWRSKKGIESDEDEDAEKDVAGGISKVPLPKHNEDSNESEEESDEDEEDDDEEDKPKGVSHLIEIENPNRIKQKAKKVTELVVASDKPNLTRREREELEKQQAKEKYQKLHEAGKTEEARSDLARLALIRKQREEAAKKREEERKLAEDSKTDKKIKA